MFIGKFTFMFTIVMTCSELAELDESVTRGNQSLSLTRTESITV